MFGVNLQLATIRGPAGPAPGPSYEDFLAHVNSVAVATKSWALVGGGDTAGLVKTTASAFSSDMTGSPWGPSSPAGARTSSPPSRIVQHSAPSEAVANMIAASGLVVMYRVVANGSAAAVAVNRNGYQSFAGGASSMFVCDFMAYWDTETGKAMQMNPQLGTGPTPYTW